MSSDSTDNAELSEAAAAFLCSLNIGENNESNKTYDDNDICANCGKDGDGDNMNTCNKCDLVKYCNAACKKKHKSKHKNKCERRVAEIYDEKLFRDPPPPEECPICFLPLAVDASDSTFFPCCGKNICTGCICAMLESKGANLCAFCRTPGAKSYEENVKRVNNLMEKGNAIAFYVFAGFYEHGRMGMPQDWLKANELYLKAGEFGCAAAYFNLGNAFCSGERGVEVDMMKAKHYWELAAVNGSARARYNIGCIEEQAGNPQCACKHFILAAKAGHDISLNQVKTGFKHGLVTKDEYATTLRAHQKSQDEMKSEARDKSIL